MAAWRQQKLRSLREVPSLIFNSTSASWAKKAHPNVPRGKVAGGRSEGTFFQRARALEDKNYSAPVHITTLSSSPSLQLGDQKKIVILATHTDDDGPSTFGAVCSCCHNGSRITPRSLFVWRARPDDIQLLRGRARRSQLGVRCPCARSRTGAALYPTPFPRLCSCLLYFVDLSLVSKAAVYF